MHSLARKAKKCIEIYIRCLKHKFQKSKKNIMVSTSGSDSKGSAFNAGDLGSIPGLGRSPGEGNGNPLQYSCLENPIEKPGRLQSTGSQSVRHD